MISYSFRSYILNMTPVILNIPHFYPSYRYLGKYVPTQDLPFMHAPVTSSHSWLPPITWILLSVFGEGIAMICDCGQDEGQPGLEYYCITKYDNLDTRAIASRQAGRQAGSI